MRPGVDELLSAVKSAGEAALRLYAENMRLADERDGLRRELAEAQQALQRIAAIVHTGGLRGLTDSQAVTYARQLSLPYWDKTGSSIAMGRRVDAAIDAAMAEPKP
jgi:hypothetical protein